MSNDPKDVDIDETPEYPLPSPTDSLSRDQRPPDDDVEPKSDEKKKKIDIQKISGPHDRDS